MTNPQPPTFNLAEDVGNVCLSWSEIEEVVHDIVLQLACVVDKNFETQTTIDLLHLAISHMDFREKAATAKVFAHHVDTHLSPDLYDRTEQLLNYLDNDARSERNRYVHDQWLGALGSTIRSQIRPRIVRPQAKQRALATHSDRVFADRTKINEFAKNLEYAVHDLWALNFHIRSLASASKPSTKSPQPLPAVWQCLTHRDWRDSSKR